MSETVTEAEREREIEIECECECERSQNVKIATETTTRSPCTTKDNLINLDLLPPTRPINVCTMYILAQADVSRIGQVSPFCQTSHVQCRVSPGPTRPVGHRSCHIKTSIIK